MNLDSFSAYFGTASTRGADFFTAVRATERLQRLTGSEQRTEPLLATLALQVLAFSGAISAVTTGRLASALVVPTDTPNGATFNLVALEYSPRAGGMAEPVDFRQLVSSSAVLDATQAWRGYVLEAPLDEVGSDAGDAGAASSRAEWRRRLADALDPSFALEALQTGRLGLIVGSMPRVEYTGIPLSPTGICPPGEVAERCTAGVIATNSAGATGVTTVYHALGAALPLGLATCRVGAARGRIISADPVSDSCFIEVVPPPARHPTRGARGPLRNVTPRQKEPVTASGLVSPNMQGYVTAWDVTIPMIMPHAQHRVYTTPITVPGDSGAALVDASDDVLGFASFRTGFGEPIEFSAWIWAESVYHANRLR